MEIDEQLQDSATIASSKRATCRTCALRKYSQVFDEHYRLTNCVAQVLKSAKEFYVLSHEPVSSIPGERQGSCTQSFRDRLATLDERLAGAVARPVVLPETIVVDRGKVFVSAAFTAACETLGISVQPAPPHTPTAKGIAERTFGSINALFCQQLPGYTGPDVTRRGPSSNMRSRAGEIRGRPR